MNLVGRIYFCVCTPSVRYVPSVLSQVLRVAMRVRFKYTWKVVHVNETKTHHNRKYCWSGEQFFLCGWTSTKARKLCCIVRAENVISKIWSSASESRGQTGETRLCVLLRQQGNHRGNQSHFWDFRRKGERTMKQVLWKQTVRSIERPQARNGLIAWISSATEKRESTCRVSKALSQVLSWNREINLVVLRHKRPTHIW